MGTLGVGHIHMKCVHFGRAYGKEHDCGTVEGKVTRVRKKKSISNSLVCSRCFLFLVDTPRQHRRHHGHYKKTSVIKKKKRKQEKQKKGMAFQITRTKTNDVYHKLIDRHTWMVEWGITRSNRWWQCYALISWGS